LVNKTGSHELVREDLSFEVRTSSSRASAVFHVSTLKSRAAEMLSKHTGKGLNINYSGSTTHKTSGFDMTTKLSTIAVNETTVHTLGKTENVNNFVDHAYHILFVKKDVSSGLNELATDDSTTDKGSVGTRGHREGSRVSYVISRVIDSDNENEIGIDTVLQDRGSRDTTDRALGDLKFAVDWVLDSKSTG
jgi:hypothetical protein